MEEAMFQLEEELKKLPAKPGVYLMHDKQDNIIYVGKAISLKNRVRQYFQTRQRMPKIEKMISQIASFEYIVVGSEMEALVLECNLIKEYRPRYNTMLMDDKAYPYIMVTVQEDFPRVVIAREQKRDKAKYFGPYTSAGAVKDILELLRKLYFIRSCNKGITPEKPERPCLYYQMGQCKAPCAGLISKEDYGKSIHEVIEFLNGNYKLITADLEKKMQDSAEAQEYEQAAEYRDLLRAVKQIAQQQRVTDTDGGNRDIIALARAEEDAVVQVFFIRGGKMLGREHFHLNVQGGTRNEVMTEFVKQYYAGAPSIPKELLLSDAVEEEELITRWLSERKGQKVVIRIPKKGDKERLVELAYKNASMVLQQDAEKIKREEARTFGALRELGDMLGIPGLKRIESYDISNISGFESVGSLVVFEDGRPKKSDYRKFKIQTVTGPDDYASLHEVLTRRFRHGAEEEAELKAKGMDISLGSFTRYPQLILMDGGRGQVNIALSVLEGKPLGISVCGMVKDDHHRTRGMYFNGKELPLSPSSEVFKLITRIQDETHRFAIEYHRSLRSKKQTKSILDDIEGIGDSRRRALMRHFQSFDKIRNASVEELASVESMNRRAAEQVYEFFRSARDTAQKSGE